LLSPALVDILNPSGEILVGDEQFTAMTEGEDIGAGKSIVVTGVYAGGVLKVVEPGEAPSELTSRSWRDRVARYSLAHIIRQRRER